MLGPWISRILRLPVGDGAFRRPAEADAALTVAGREVAAATPAAAAIAVKTDLRVVGIEKRSSAMMRWDRG